MSTLSVNAVIRCHDRYKNRTKNVTAGDPATIQESERWLYVRKHGDIFDSEDFFKLSSKKDLVLEGYFKEDILIESEGDKYKIEMTTSQLDDMCFGNSFQLSLFDYFEAAGQDIKKIDLLDYCLKRLNNEANPELVNENTIEFPIKITILEDTLSKDVPNRETVQASIELTLPHPNDNLVPVHVQAVDTFYLKRI